MQFFENLTAFLWGVPAVTLFVLCGVWLTLKSRFFQFRRIGSILKCPFYKDETSAKGQMSGLQAAAMAIGGSVGVANISGVATAVVTGGPGALFWMLAAALLGMIIKTAEVTLASHYRVREKGKVWGGPTYYMQRFLGDEKGKRFWRVPAYLFGGGIFVSFFLNVQNYAVAEAIGSTFSMPIMIPSLFLAGITYIMIAGGLSSLGKISGYLVPFMCLFYMGCVGLVLLKNAGSILPSLRLILRDAWDFKAAAGAGAGTAVRIGFARAVYSNEAGWGTSPMIHATAEVSHPVRQGILGAFEVFVDTMLVCTATGLLVICTGAYQNGLSGAALSLSAIEGELGSAARVIVALSVFLFGLSSGVGWYAYYVTLINHAVKNEKRKERLLRGIMLFSPLLGVLLTYFVDRSGGESRLLWTIADFSAVFPTIINLSVLISMRGRFGELIDDFEKR